MTDSLCCAPSSKLYGLWGNGPDVGGKSSVRAISLNGHIFKLQEYLGLYTYKNAAFNLYILFFMNSIYTDNEFWAYLYISLSSIFSDLWLITSSQFHSLCLSVSLFHSVCLSLFLSLCLCLSNHCIQLILSIHAWVKSHLLELGKPTRDHTSKENWLFFTFGKHQLWMTLQLGWEILSFSVYT